jgi:hypothetical protein
MKFLVRVAVIFAAVFLFAPASFAVDPLPTNSGFIVWMVPQAHLYDFGPKMTWKDKIGGKDYSIDNDLITKLTGGIGLQASYITAASVFVNLELSYHVYLYNVDKDKFEDIDFNQSKITLTNGREELIIGYYFLPAPFRPYIAVGGGIDQEKFQAFQMTAYSLAFNASGMVGGDFFFSRHGAVGAGLRADYTIGETFSKKFTRNDVEHDATATLTRIPLVLFAKIGYMF